jgi:hypothetical protein
MKTWREARADSLLQKKIERAEYLAHRAATKPLSLNETNELVFGNILKANAFLRSVWKSHA